MKCSSCNAKGKTRKRKDGAPALPYKWVRNEQGKPICLACKPKEKVCNYAYAARPEADSLDALDAQMRHGNRYRNTLIGIERQRRERVDELLRQHSPELARIDAEITAAEAVLAEVRRAIRAGNSVAGAKLAGTAAQRAQATQWRATLKSLGQQRQQLRKKLFREAAVRAALKALDGWAVEEQKRQRALCGCYWGTYIQVEQGAKGLRKGAPPDYHRFDGGGHVAVQLQGGLATSAALLCQDTQFRLEILPGAETAAGPLARAWLRIGSDAKGKPIWATVRLRLHRPLPENAAIKWVHLTRRRVATHDRWTLVLALAGNVRPRDQATAGRVFVRPGWARQADGSLLMARWQGDDGAVGELRLPAETVERWRVAEGIAGVRTRLFNRARDGLVAWLAANPHPEWLDEQTPHLAQWRSPERLAAVVRYWREHRFTGDEAIFGDWEAWQQIRHEQGGKAYHEAVKDANRRGQLNAWLIEERHLYEYQEGTRGRAIRQRQALQREFVAELRRRYQTVAVPKVNYRELLEKEEAESDLDRGFQRLYPRMAAPGELVRFFAESAGTLERVSPGKEDLAADAA